MYSQQALVDLTDPPRKNTFIILPDWQFSHFAEHIIVACPFRHFPRYPSSRFHHILGDEITRSLLARRELVDFVNRNLTYKTQQH